MRLSADFKYLLLDTCIIEYWLDEDLNPSITTLISKWGDSSTLPAVSDISYAELIRGAHREKVQRVKDLLGGFTNLEVSQRILAGSGVLQNIYKAQNPQTNGASVEDMVIATASFIHELPIITADVGDFPHPFFTQEKKENIIFTKKGRDRMVSIAMLVPDLPALKYWDKQTN